MLVLHHHQRAGPQVAISRRRRHRATRRENAAQKITRFFITDDNFARNKNWEAIFDRLIELREKQGLKISFLIQVDTLAHKIPRFIEKAAERAAATPSSGWRASIPTISLR